VGAKKAAKLQIAFDFAPVGSSEYIHHTEHSRISFACNVFLCGPKQDSNIGVTTLPVRMSDVCAY